MSDILKAGLLERLGVTDSAITDESLLAAFDVVLDQATAPAAPAAVPAGTVLIDSAVLSDLQASAALGRKASEAQDTARRTAIVDSAVNDGRIAPASRATWLDSLNVSEEGTTALIASLAKNTIPVTEIGTADEPNEADNLYALAFGNDTKEA